MPKILVLYQTTSGYTKKYAQWISEALAAELSETKNFDASKLPAYDLIIFGGSLHAVGISGVKVIKDNLPKLTDKKLIVFAVGASPPRETIPQEVIGKNFTEEQQKNIKFFYLRGGFDYNKLDLPNKFLMTLMRVRLLLKKKEKRTHDEIGLLAAFSKPIDCTRKENISCIIEYAKSPNER
jgi:menaquinone-dependent protoporphyrinogen IX oxidase